MFLRVIILAVIAICLQGCASDNRAWQRPENYQVAKNSYPVVIPPTANKRDFKSNYLIPTPPTHGVSLLPPGFVPQPTKS